jgi:hypothetical protein
MKSLKIRIEEILNGCCVLEETSDIQFIFENHVPSLDSNVVSAIDSIWKETSINSNVFDDDVLYYSKHFTKSDMCYLYVFWGPYRYFYAMSQDPSLKLPFVPLSVSGICENESRCLIVGRRQNATEYQGKLEFVPSGGLSREFYIDGEVRYHQQLINEYVSETTSNSDSINSIRTLGVVMDLKHSVIDIGCVIQTNLGEKKSFNDSKEYTNIQWLNLLELDSYTLIPSSRALYNLYLHR